MAQPAVAVAVAVPVTAQAVHVVQIQSGGANANQQWKSELCGCCEDGCTCMAGCCCPCITSVQLAIKVGMTKTTACKSLSAFLFMLYFLAALLYVLGYLMQQCIPIRSSYSGTYYGNVCIPNITLWYFALFCVGKCCIIMFIFVCQARKKVREHSGIPGDACQDCCCTYCCMPCTTCQIFRHLGIGGGASYPTKYELCSPTGENKPALLG